MLPLALMATIGWQSVAAAEEATLPRDEWLPLLIKVSQVVRQQSERLRNFTCVKSVNRHTIDGKRRESRDTLRFETGIVGDGEVFGWPGQELSQDSPNGLVAFGASTTGDLYSTVRSAVGNREVTILQAKRGPSGEVVFSYEMGALNSHFTVSGPTASATVPFRGEFAVEPTEPRLLWFRKEADDIPVAVGTRRTETMLRYNRKANQPPFDIVPVSAVTVMHDWWGRQSTLSSTWQGCAEYAVTSDISFGDEHKAAAAGHRLISSWLGVREGTFSTELSGETALANLTAGDSVAMRLSSAVTLSDGSQLPVGTRLMTRVVLNHVRPDDRTRIVGLRLDPHVGVGRRVLLDATAEQITGSGVETGVRVTRYSARSNRVGSMSSFESSEEKLYLDRSAGAATFMLPLGAAKLPLPLKIRWRADPAARSEALRTRAGSGN
ncbi:MAG: hypothetical protein NTV70_11900 [Acidobacteria bacterium]|nr:hypothetical protein [Acidobacteriota bacterium]